MVAFATMASQVIAANNALVVNPVVADADLTVRGSDWLWAVFAVMLASALGVLAWSFLIPAGQRTFHWIGIALLFTASIAYFSMASDLGSTPVYVEFVRYGSLYSGNANPYTRSIWYARYIDWVITTPLLLLELLLATGMPLSGIFGIIFMDEVMIIGGLIGALVPSVYKWGYFVGATVALLYITWALIVPARANAKALSVEAHKAYLTSAGLLCFLWLLYPVAWGLADGGNVISTDSEMIFYGILDILAKPVFLLIHLYALRKVPYESFGLQSGHFSAYASVPTNGTNQNVMSSRTTGDNPALASGKRQSANPNKVASGPVHPVGTNQTAIAGNGPVGGQAQSGTMYPVNADNRRSDVTAV
ncbi:hypothetical protein EMMF5_003577 [Cystobasidiomycetes sp. EMM_F5]